MLVFFVVVFLWWCGGVFVVMFFFVVVFLSVFFSGRVLCYFFLSPSGLDGEKWLLLARHFFV